MENSSQRFNKSIFTISCASSRALLVVLGVLTSGCVAGPNFGGGPEEVVTKDFPEMEIRPPVYLTPGDVLSIEFLYWPELDVEQHTGDIRDADVVAHACEGVDTVFHVAAIPGIWGPWSLYHGINTLGIYGYNPGVVCHCAGQTHRRLLR